MSSPGSESSWRLVEHREQELEAAKNKRATLYEQAQLGSSAANLTSARRLGTSRTHLQTEDSTRPPPPPLAANVSVSAPAATTSFVSRKSAPKEFPRTAEDKVDWEPSKGTSFARKVKTSLLGGKNPFLSSNKSTEREKERPEPIIIPPLSPKPDTVTVGCPGTEHREQEIEAAKNKQAMLYGQAQLGSSAANLTSARRLGTSRTHLQTEDSTRPPPPPLVANVLVSAPAATTSFVSRKSAPKEFPRIMSSPGSESSWCLVEHREQELEAAKNKRAMLYEQAQLGSSAANLTSARRLGTSRTHFQTEDSTRPPPPLVANVSVSAPAATTSFVSRKSAPKEFPRTAEDKVDWEPSKGTSFARKVKTSLLRGKNPFLSSNKSTEREKERPEPIIIPPLSPEPDTVTVGCPGTELDVSTPEPPLSRSSRTHRPSPVTSYPRTLHSAQSPQPRPRRGSSAAPPEPGVEPSRIEKPPSRSSKIPIFEVSGRRVENLPSEREPVLGALQTHRLSPGEAIFTAPVLASTSSTIRPLPPTLVSSQPPASSQPPISSQSPVSFRPLSLTQLLPHRPLLAPAPSKSNVVVALVPQPTRPYPASLNSGARYCTGSSSHQANSSLPVVRCKTSSDRVSYAITSVPQPNRPSPATLNPGAHYRNGSSSHQTNSSPRVVRHETSRDRTSYISSSPNTSTTLQGRWQLGPPSRSEEFNYNNSPCLICFDVPKNFPRFRPTSRCTHKSTICAPCLEQHISYAVRTRGLTTLTCPDTGCRQAMEYADALRGAKNDRACLDRYETLLLRRTLEKEPNFIWCKNPTCNWGQVHEGGAAAPIVICQVCRARSCFTHDVPWHTGLTCEQYTIERRAEMERQDHASQTYIEQHAKRCPGPSCGRLIEKTDGCDHMTCFPLVGCGHEFCWVCLADYEPIRREGNHRHRDTCQHYAPSRSITPALIVTPFEGEVEEAQLVQAERLELLMRWEDRFGHVYDDDLDPF